MKKLLSFLLLGICASVSADNAPCLPASGCTGISNSNTSTVTLGGAFSTQGVLSLLGAYSLSATLTGNTSITFPTSGTLISSSGSYADPSWITSLDGSKISNGTLSLTTKVTGILPNANTTATNSNTISTIVSRDASGNFSAGTITAALSGNASTATNASTVTTNANLTGPITSVGNATSVTNNAIADTMLRQSSALSVIGNSTNSTANVADISAASDNQVLRRSGTAIAFGAVNLASSSAVTGATPVLNGGTGQTTYTNGQLLIGNTTGNTLSKATLTGTANQITVTNGGGSIIISIPATPQFTGLTLTNAPNLSLGTAVSNVLMLNSSSGASNRADYQMNRFDLSNGNARAVYSTGGSLKWSAGTRAGSEDYVVWDETNSVAQLAMTQASGSSGLITFAGSLTAGGEISASTAGKTLQIKTGSNACAGSAAVMVAGAVTVNTSCATTGSFIQLMKTTAAGTPTSGDPVISIVNGVSFTITGSSLDTSTWSWMILHTN